MSTPVEVPMSEQQRELYAQLLSDVQRAQSHYLLFCETVFRGIGVAGVQNIQRLNGKLMGEIPDPPKVEP